MSSPGRRCGAIAEEMAATGGSRLTCLGDTVTSNRNRIRTWSASLAATLMVTVSASALHAETSNAELAKEIAELKAQIRAMKGAISQNRVEARKAVRVARPAAPYTLPPPGPAPAFAGGVIPPGATPVFVTADKKMQFGALTITPGGFVAMESRSSTRSESTDFQSNFSAIPNSNNPNAHVPESRLSERQSRIALLIEAPITPNYLVSGYGEFDFLAAGTTSNLNQTDSFVPRIRHLYATLDNAEYGMHVLAGQDWSLVTLNSKGITPRNEVTPPQIDPSFIPGFAYGRLPQIRLTKDFDKRLWLSISAEASQTTGNQCANAVAVPTLGIANSTCATPANGPSLNSIANTFNISYNKYPDVVGKIAYEAKLGTRDVHLEGLGIYRGYLSNVNYGTLQTANGAVVPSTAFAPNGYPSSSNQSTSGYGVGFGLIVPIIPKRLDFQASGLLGRGIGRYTSSGGFQDVALTGNGSVRAVGQSMALVGAIAHVTPSIDVYAFAGFEQQNRTYYQLPNGGFIGYGAPGGFNNTGCNVEGGTCTGQQHRVYQITGGFWDKLYKGAFGEVRVGAQYSFTERQLFAATANANGVPTAAEPRIAANANAHTILTSLRYYPFQ